MDKVIEYYAPAIENNIETYVNSAKKSEIVMNKKMKDMNTDERQKILDAMQKHEGWKEGKIEYQRKEQKNEKKNPDNDNVV